MTLFDENKILLEYYNIICNARNTLNIQYKPLNCENFDNISSYKYCNYNTINDFTSLLLNRLNLYKQYSKLNMDIIY
jgi:hypothetical protein